MKKFNYLLENGDMVEVDVTIEVYLELESESKYQERLRNQHRRHGDSRPFDDFSIQIQKSASVPSAEEEALDSLYLERIREVVLRHHSMDAYRRFILHYVCGYTRQEIATMENVHLTTIDYSINMVKSTLLKYYLEEEEM